MNIVSGELFTLKITFGLQSNNSHISHDLLSGISIQLYSLHRSTPKIGQFVYNTSLLHITSAFIAYIKTTFFEARLKITSKPQELQETRIY